MGRKIKPARLEKGLTQQQLADMSNVSLKTIGNIESGRIVPQAASLRRLLIALDLGIDPADAYPEDVRTWLAVLGPLIANLPDETRGAVMTRVVTSLGEVLADQVARFSAGMTPAQVESELDKAQRAGIVPRPEGNVHHLPRPNLQFNPDGMPPFNPTRLIAAREVPDELSSLRPQVSNPEDFPDPEGPEGGA